MESPPSGESPASGGEGGEGASAETLGEAVRRLRAVASGLARKADELGREGGDGKVGRRASRRLADACRGAERDLRRLRALLGGGRRPETPSEFADEILETNAAIADFPKDSQSQEAEAPSEPPEPPKPLIKCVSLTKLLEPKRDPEPEPEAKKAKKVKILIRPRRPRRQEPIELSDESPPERPPHEKRPRRSEKAERRKAPVDKTRIVDDSSSAGDENVRPEKTSPAPGKLEKRPKPNRAETKPAGADDSSSDGDEIVRPEKTATAPLKLEERPEPIRAEKALPETRPFGVRLTRPPAGDALKDFLIARGLVRLSDADGNAILEIAPDHAAKMNSDAKKSLNASSDSESDSRDRAPVKSNNKEKKRNPSGEADKKSRTAAKASRKKAERLDSDSDVEDSRTKRRASKSTKKKHISSGDSDEQIPTVSKGFQRKIVSSSSDEDFKKPKVNKKKPKRARVSSDDNSDGQNKNGFEDQNDISQEKLKSSNIKASEENSTMKKGKSNKKKSGDSPVSDDLGAEVEPNHTDESDNEMINNKSTKDGNKSTVKFAADLLNESSNDEDSSTNVNGDHESSKNNSSKGKKNVKSSKKSDEAEIISDNSDIEAVPDNSSKVKEETLGGTDSNDSEIFKPTKSRRKKKKVSEDSEDDSSRETKNKKKRRRIKNMSGEDSDSSKAENDSDSDGEGKKHGRKNIRKVKHSGKLDEATRTAARKEKERIQRIAQRQKLYNESLFDETGRPDEAKKLEKVDLDFDPETKEPVISIDKGLVEKLKPHQANGIKFMWNACFESVKQIKETKGSGCILAHCMGLGKTLQVVTLVHTLLTHQELTKVERVLVVCPLSTVLNWVNEFNMWLKFAKCKDDFEIYEISKYKQNYERANKLKEWLECGGVCVLGYDMFRNLSADNNKKFRKAQLNAFQKSLVDPGPDLVVCDEGHLLKNEKTSLSQAMNKIKTLRRIVLTGTPLQNNLKEYYCMVQFVKPNLLGKYNEYLNRFVNPITNGQYTDSTEHDIRVMKRRSHVLHTMLHGAVQRRDYAVLAPFLPPKHEYVLFISLTDIQIKLYSYYMENFSRRPQPDRKNTGFLFPDFQALQRIWTHPLVLKANSERYEILQQKKRDKEEEEDSEGSLADFIDDEDTTTPDESSSMASSDESDCSAPRNKKKKGKAKTPKKRITRATAPDSDEPLEIKPEEPPRQDNPTEWWISLCSDNELNDVRLSHKLLLLLDILKMCDAIGDKLLVFSQSLYSLDLIEQFLWKIDEATQKDEADEKLAGHMGSWSPGIDYFRLDGSTSCENRSIWCKNFNKEDNPRARLFLISTRAGGLGINLVAANRVVIFDMSWNPSHDVQSIFRVYRFGQKKPCYVYRFLALGTMEEKIYERQVTKQAISKRVIDEQQIDRHYAESDLAELYNFCPVPEGTREVPKLPKDRLFADLLKEHDTKIYKYHEHDSLLENKEEETLTEEERKAAWEDYENEKTRPPPTFGGNFFTGFQQQQQHQMAMNAILQQDYPNLSEQQIAAMLPGILQQMYQGADGQLPQSMYPGYDFNLLQKLFSPQTSLMGGYKYPQVNPGMMMNSGNMASGTAPGMIPTWQQQQKIQLQRLQQQQQMQANLKYYAGGLGSRDTLDMAALQQRQRQMMMSANPSLPQRGRPPKQPMMPIVPAMAPLKPGEVVELDSE